MDELDELTLARAQRGDPRALAALIARYQQPAYALLSRMLGPARRAHAAEDLCQETFLRVCRALPSFRVDGPARLSTWILTIAARLALSELGRKPAAAPPEPEPRERPDQLAERRAVGRAVARAIDDLPPEYRSVVILREYHELDYEEIARALEIDLGTVKSRLFRGRARLREALKELQP